MRNRDALNAAEALVLTMVLVAAADGGMTDREIGIMSGLVQTLPAFQDFTSERLADVTDRAVRLLHEDDGLAHAGRLIRSAADEQAEGDRVCARLRGCRGRPGVAARVTGYAGVRARGTGTGPADFGRDRTRGAGAVSAR